VTDFSTCLNKHLIKYRKKLANLTKTRSNIFMSPGKTSILLTLALVSGVAGYVHWSNQTTPSAPLKPISAPAKPISAPVIEPVIIEEPPQAVVTPTAPLAHPPLSRQAKGQGSL
jgi:hypothetical protein